MSKETRVVDAIRCGAGVMPGCDTATLMAKKLGFSLPERIPRAKRRPWDGLLDWWWRFRFRRALRKALPADLWPILDKPLVQADANDLNRLRLVLNEEWRNFAFALGPPEEVEKGVAEGAPTNISEGLRDLVQKANEEFVEPTQPVVSLGENPEEK